MGVLFLIFALEFGFMPDLYYKELEPQEVTESLNGQCLYADGEIGIEYRGLFALISTRVMFLKIPEPGYTLLFAPFRDIYGIDIGYKRGIVTAGVRHECDHPVISRCIQMEKTEHGGYTSLYLRISND